MGTELPTSPTALAGYALLLAYLAWMGWHQNRKTRGVATVVDKIDEQVSNSHSTNLREELDERHDEILGILREFRTDLSEVRTTTDRTETLTKRIGAEVRDDRKDFDKHRRETNVSLRRLTGIAAKHHPEEG